MALVEEAGLPEGEVGDIGEGRCRGRWRSFRWLSWRSWGGLKLAVMLRLQDHFHQALTQTLTVANSVGHSSGQHTVMLLISDPAVLERMQSGFHVSLMQPEMLCFNPLSWDDGKQIQF